MRGILGLALVSALTGLAAPALAQTAAEINRLNQAIQICNPPARRRSPSAPSSTLAWACQTARLWRAGRADGPGRGGRRTTAGILGALNAAMATRSPAPVAAPPRRP